LCTLCWVSDLLGGVLINSGKFSECHPGSPTCLTLQSLPQIQNLFHSSCTPCWVSDLLDGVLINVWVNLLNVMLGLRLVWLHKVYRKPNFFFYILCTPCWCGSNDFQDYFDDAKESRVKQIPKI